jgi:hypothetical protein
MPPLGFWQKIYIVCLFDRNQNLLLCTPLVYIHGHGPYKTFKKNVNEVSLHVSELFNYFTKIDILLSDTKKLGIHCIVLDWFSIYFF